MAHDDRQQQRREGVDRVRDDDEHAVQPAAEVAGDQPEQHADHDRHEDGGDDHVQRRPRAPDDAGEHVVPTDRGAQPVRRRRLLLGAERAAGVAQLVELVGRQQRREDRGDQEDAGQDQSGDEHAALQADALAELVDDRQAAPPAGPAAGGGGVGGLGVRAGGHLSTSPGGR
ncbi:hypothetical protein JKP76_03080 [Blastococcus sp. TML/C7B]|uniref:hypothetical protein n=1 Tax=Blastococcus sp. TML/C7B TaxID=2798728 RepID=UPI00190C5762|nr:hypothetical protein [Blastococcus sp. TML/C7B]MBN1095113.1 hypothetical protein [Blastococcus sp. TML/C7B]